MTHARLLAVCVGFACLAGALSACAGETTTGSTGPASVAAQAPSAATSAAAPVSAASLDLTHYSTTFESQAGYKVGVTVAVSPVMLGTDTNALNQAWASVGGSGEVPCTSGAPKDENPNFTIQPETVGYSFGTITLTNESPGFTPQAIPYILHGLNGLGAAGLGFSDGSQCQSLVNGLVFSPNWTSNTWGPVPMVIAVYSYRSPAQPNGDASMLKTGMYFGIHDFAFPLSPAR